MADPAELLLSTTNRLNSIAAEILELEQKAENAWRNYQGAEKGHKTAANKYWEAAVKDKEAARRIQQTLLDERKALIDKLPAAGKCSVKSELSIQASKWERIGRTRFATVCLSSDLQG